jgi:hypothetical protein
VVVGGLVDSTICSLTVVVGGGGGEVVVVAEVVTRVVEDTSSSTVVASVDTFSGAKVIRSGSFGGGSGSRTISSMVSLSLIPTSVWISCATNECDRHKTVHKSSNSFQLCPAILSQLGVGVRGFSETRKRNTHGSVFQFSLALRSTSAQFEVVNLVTPINAH